MRVAYSRKLYGQVKGEIYADIYNILDRQGATGLSESTNLWSAAPVADTPYQYQAPRNVVVGAKITF